MTASRKIVAFLALWCLLGITTLSAMPVHGHENDTTRVCDICNSGHLPCLQPISAIQFCTQTPLVWQQPPENIQHCPTSAAVIRSPRAPPI